MKKTSCSPQKLGCSSRWCPECEGFKGLHNQNPSKKQNLIKSWQEGVGRERGAFEKNRKKNVYVLSGFFLSLFGPVIGKGFEKALELVFK